MPDSERPPEDVLIAGCGYVGVALGELLAAAGDRVIGLRRHADEIPAPIEPFAADLATGAGLERLPPVDRVVYAAAASGRTVADYRAAYVDGPRRLLEALARQERPPRRLVLVSSTSVHEDAAGEVVTEDSPAEPESPFGRLLREGEEIVRAAACPTVVTRFGGIYGPGRDRLIRLVREGRARLRGGPPRWTNRIHRADCAGALAHLLADAAPTGLYLGVDDAPTPFDEVLAGIAALLELPPPPQAADTAGGGAESAASRMLASNKRCSNARLRAAGYDFRYPTWREGMAAILQEERA